MLIEVMWKNAVCGQMRYVDFGWGTLKQVSLEASFLGSLHGASEYGEQNLPHSFDCGTLFVVQSLSHVWLFVTQWIAACQASLSFPISWGLLIFMSIESEMPSNYLILCCPLLLFTKTLSEKCKSKPQWGTITCQSEWLLSRSLHAINAGESVEKREPSYTVGGNAN